MGRVASAYKLGSGVGWEEMDYYTDVEAAVVGKRCMRMCAYVMANVSGHARHLHLASEF